MTGVSSAVTAKPPEARPVVVLSALGTRPEAIKLAPVIRQLEADADLQSRVLVTAQHRELLDQHLAPFGIVPDIDLDLMRPGQTLAELTSHVVENVDRVLGDERPDLLLVQGDTTTVFGAALAAFYRGIPVGHVEAGLRSFDLANPFPEEANRRLTSQVATLHFAPTRRAEQNLLAERVPRERVVLTGNPVVDVVKEIAERPDLPPPWPWREVLQDGACRVLVTLHRRENWGAPLERMCRGLRRAVDEVPGLDVVYPVHLQPRVRETVTSLLAGHPRIALMEPLDYLANIAAMRACSFIVTDSGGIQEEAPVLGKPVLVLREVTERPEAMEAGTSWLVGTEERNVYDAIVSLATDTERRRAMANAVSPFGDGRASERIVAAIRRYVGLPALPNQPAELRSPLRAA
jgi:UDP-N-acetylglucosamine 2-epimerase (non-hydrolysing)